MENFWQSVLSNAVAEIIVTVLISIVTFFYHRFRGRSIPSSTNEERNLEGLSVGRTIDDFIQRSQRQQSSQFSEVHHRTTVTTTYTTKVENKSDDDGFGIIFIVLLAAAAADAIWTKYQGVIIFIAMALIGIGIGTSFYFAYQLRKMRPPYRLEDNVWSFGCLVIWLVNIGTVISAAYYPLLPQTITGDKISTMFAHLVQLIGMGILFITVLTAALTQLSISLAYKRILQNRQPYKLLIRIWKSNISIFVGIVFGTIFAFMLGTGLYYRLFFPS